MNITGGYFDDHSIGGDDDLLPNQLPAALTGPGGTDPFRGAQALTCASLLTETGHCWATSPSTSP